MLLERLSPEEQATLASICTVRNLPAGASVIREGEAGDSLFIVRRGRLEVRKQLGNGEYKVLEFLGAGDVVGEIGFLNRTPRSASVVAVASSELLELGCTQLQAMAERNPVMGMKVYRAIAEILAARLSENTMALRKAVLWAIEGSTVV